LEEVVTQETVDDMNLLDNSLVLPPPVSGAHSVQTEAYNVQAIVEGTVEHSGVVLAESMEEKEGSSSTVKILKHSGVDEGRTLKASQGNRRVVTSVPKPLSSKPGSMYPQVCSSSKTFPLAVKIPKSPKASVRPEVIVIPPTSNVKQNKSINVAETKDKGHVQVAKVGKTSRAMTVLDDTKGDEVKGLTEEEHTFKTTSVVMTQTVNTAGKDMSPRVSVSQKTVSDPTRKTNVKIVQGGRKFVGPTVKVVSFGETTQEKGKKVVSVYNPASGKLLKPMVSTAHGSQYLQRTRCPTVPENVKKPAHASTALFTEDIANSDEIVIENFKRQSEFVAMEVDVDSVHTVNLVSEDHGLSNVQNLQAEESGMDTNTVELTAVKCTSDETQDDIETTGQAPVADSLVNKLCQVIKYDNKKDQMTGNMGNFVVVDDKVVNIGGKQIRFGRNQPSTQTSQRPGNADTGHIVLYGADGNESKCCTNII